MEIAVIGHKNPDSDSVVSAIAVSYLFTELGDKSTAYTQGMLAPETFFILEYAGLDAPEIIENVAGKNVALVDFSDTPQAPQGIHEACIVAIIDHHKLGDLTTDTPLEMWVRPVGCTATIVKTMFDFHKIAIPKNIAKAMLCAILSDTVLFKSVTTTKYDIEAVNNLASLAGVENPLEVGMQMFIAKSTLADASPKELLFRDYKDFSMNGNTIGIGQLELIDINLIEDMKPALLEAMQVVKKEGERHSVLLLLTDIMKEGSLLLAVSDNPQILEEAFTIVLQEEGAWIDGMMSRKKQVIPKLHRAFE